ncbi:MAG: Rcas_1661 family thioredoxin-like (seleno)lipoprotein [Chloroflexaceae bacterium]
MVLWSSACSGQAGQQAPLPSPAREAPASITSPVTSPPRTATVMTPGAATSAATAIYAGVPHSRTPEGYHLLGNPEAPVTLVMYSDFLCTACALHVLETEPRIVSEYIQSGKVRLVYRHLLQLGERSELLAEAAECVADQGRFWEMRQAIYRRYNQLYTGTLAGVEAAAVEAGANVDELRACLAAGIHEAAVRADYEAAVAEGIRSRPVFLIGERRIIGAQPFNVFQELLDHTSGA